MPLIEPRPRETGPAGARERRRRPGSASSRPRAPWRSPPSRWGCRRRLGLQGLARGAVGQDLPPADQGHLGDRPRAVGDVGELQARRGRDVAGPQRRGCVQRPVAPRGASEPLLGEHADDGHRRMPTGTTTNTRTNTSSATTTNSGTGNGTTTGINKTNKNTNITLLELRPVTTLLLIPIP